VGSADLDTESYGDHDHGSDLETGACDSLERRYVATRLTLANGRRRRLRICVTAKPTARSRGGRRSQQLRPIAQWFLDLDPNLTDGAVESEYLLGGSRRRRNPQRCEAGYLVGANRSSRGHRGAEKW
jgi:hypothetical protein